MSKIDDLLKLAFDELCYLEKSRKAYNQDPTILYSKTDGAGEDNYTKYAMDIGHANGQPWCQTFINWLFCKTLGRELANTILCGMMRSASTMEVKNAFKAAGRLVDLAAAQPGDIVWRARNGGGHVGLVIKREGAIITTIEGNSSSTDITSWNGGAVVKHVGASWTWCGRPDWSIVPKYQVGWNKDATGWWYAPTSTSFLANCWKKINQHWYWFDKDGYAVTGHHIIEGKPYYFATLEDPAVECSLMISDVDGSLTEWLV